MYSRRGSGRRASSVMEGGQEVLKRESMGRRFKGELKDLVERIHCTEVSRYTGLDDAIFYAERWEHFFQHV